MKLFKDMDTEQFWLTLWSLASVVVLAITTAISIVNFNEDRLLHELVLAGHDPLELSCLFDSTTKEMPCFILAQEKAKTYVSK